MLKVMRKKIGIFSYNVYFPLFLYIIIIWLHHPHQKTGKTSPYLASSRIYHSRLSSSLGEYLVTPMLSSLMLSRVRPILFDLLSYFSESATHRSLQMPIIHTDMEKLSQWRDSLSPYSSYSQSSRSYAVLSNESRILTLESLNSGHSGYSSESSSSRDDSSSVDISSGSHSRVLLWRGTHSTTCQMLSRQGLHLSGQFSHSSVVLYFSLQQTGRLS